MTFRAGTILGGLLVALAMGRPLGAQGSVMDVGLSVVTFKEDSTTVFGPWLRVTANGAHGNFFGTLSGGGVLTFGAGSGSLSALGGARGTLGLNVLGELTGEVATVAGSSKNGAAGTALLSGRALWSVSDGGLWLRSTGHSSDRPNSIQTGLGIESGAWWSWSRLQISAFLSQEWTGAELYTQRFRQGFAGTTPVRYAETGVSVHYDGDGTSFDYSTSARRDPDAAHLFERSQSATLSLWASSNVAFLFTGSRQLADFVRGADAADAVSVGLRVGPLRPSLDRAARMGVLVSVADAAEGQVLRILAQGAKSVDIMADFTEWSIRPLTKVSDHFEAYVAITSGSHRMLVRVNGGAWRPAANTPAVDDDLGGRSGVLVVP